MTRSQLTELRAARLGSLLQGALNDLKRDRATAAQELGIEPSTLEAALSGSWPSAALVRERMLERWPISERDLATLVDDTEWGVRFCSAADAAATSRTLARGGAPYYEYRDVAMSEQSPIRPEWIRMLGHTGDLDAADTGLRWNDGHALHQLTYFRGPVDFYVEVEGERRAYAMEEGDSAFIPSFLPHTFATRDADADAHILAVTFHGRIHGDVREELSLMHIDALDRALQSRAAYAARLRHAMEEGCVSEEALAESTGLGSRRLGGLLDGEETVTPSEALRIATKLGLRTSDLDGDPRGIATPVVQRKSLTTAWPFPTRSGPHYLARGLAQSDIAPRARGVVISAAREGAAPSMEVGLHQFGYVLGPGPALLTWRHGGVTREMILNAGDSYYMLPWIEHRLVEGAEPSEVLVFRAPRAIGSEALDELGRGERRAQTAFVRPQIAWYRP